MKDSAKVLDEKLDTIIDLLKHLLALELSRGGVKQTIIAKQLRVATAKVGNLLQGVKKEKD